MPDTQNLTDFPSNWKLSIPVLELGEDNETGASTPEWMVSLDNLVNSTVRGFENFTQLFGWSGKQVRATKKETAGQLMNSASIRHSDVVIVIPIGKCAPSLEVILQNGDSLDTVKIVHLGKYGSENVPLQVIEYSNCQVVGLEQQGVYLLVALRPTKRTNLIIDYDQNGRKLGQNASEFDYTKGE